MARDEGTDMIAAFLIGAALGIGATLLLKEDESEVQRFVRRVRRSGGRNRHPLTAVRHRGEDLVDAGRRTAAALRDEAAEIVATARREIRSATQDGIRRVRKARAKH